MSRIIAIDWSGAADGADKRIWLAEATPQGDVVRLEAGRDRAEIVAHLIAESQRSPDLVVGLDFAFSLPSWYLESRGLRSASELWTLADREGEEWLSSCEPPFWGRPGKAKPLYQVHLRRTDNDVPAVGGIRPKSVFQIGGAGAVGTGSIRGMPILGKLKEAGFSIWPFDAPQVPLVVEIYPRALTGAVIKGSAAERRRYLTEKYPQLSPSIADQAAASDDAFDALVSALVMAANFESLVSLPSVVDETDRLEGRIWVPRSNNDMTEPPRRGLYNSSRTRVKPVFDQLMSRGNKEQWLPRLLDLATQWAEAPSSWTRHDLTVTEAWYEPTERRLDAPLALLSWLIRNLPIDSASIEGEDDVSLKRRKLAQRDPETIARALELLRSGPTSRAWHILEGSTYPDVTLFCNDAIVVIEGKRTEAGPTTSTKWLPGRHQMIRHLDAAWEIRGNRAVYGLFIVEADRGSTRVPHLWLDAARDTTSERAIRDSLPHRSPEERAGIISGFVGVTTWQAVMQEFGLDASILPDTQYPAPAPETMRSTL